MKIAIVGGGVAGLSANAIINNLATGKHVVSLFSNSIGGDYGKGGLKYVNYTPSVRILLDEILFAKYKVKKMNGAIYHDNEIHPYPEFMKNDISKSMDVQVEFFKKTRQSSFDSSRLSDIPRCMNSPWVAGNDLCADFSGNKSIVDLLIDNFSSSNSNFYKGKLDSYLTGRIIRDYDYIIWTINPIDLFKVMCEEKTIKETSSYKEFLEFYNSDKYKKVNIYSLNVANCNFYSKIWWDYLYIPSLHYRVHRVSRVLDNLTFEVNSEYEHDKGMQNIIDNEITNLFKDLYGIDAHRGNNGKKIKFLAAINGHLLVDFNPQSWIDRASIYDNKFNYSDKIKLLGRFATLDSRMTLDKVLDRFFKLYSERF